MTTIVYHDGQLIGDRKQVALTNPTSFRDGPKVFVSKDGQFAYGFSGDAISESSRDDIEATVRSIIQKAIISSSARVDLLHIDLPGLSTGIIATKHSAWMFALGKSEVTVLDGHTHGAGTGGSFMGALLMCGMSLEDAKVACAQFDPLSGSEMDVIDTRNLEDFVITVTTDEKQ